MLTATLPAELGVDLMTDEAFSLGYQGSPLSPEKRLNCG